MKVWTLIENTSCRDDLKCEHGLSLYIETGEKQILFDAGQSEAFAQNAEVMGVDLRQAEFAVLSHGHYDHGGGLGTFLKINRNAPVYVNCHAFEAHYNAADKDIGLDKALQKDPRLCFADGATKIAEGITLQTLPCPPADTSGLQVRRNGILQPEDFCHEQYLLVEEEGKRICISGCSHKGILQIMEAFRPDVLIGGFHFMKIEEEACLAEAAKKLLEYPCVYYTGHCTGQRQFDFLKTVMGDRLHSLSTGKALDIL